MSVEAQEIFQTKMIGTWNRDCARRGRGIILRVPQPHPFGHAAFVQYDWTEKEVTEYQKSGRLPCDLTSIDRETTMIALWLFAGTTTAGLRLLPELELEVVPDFTSMPAYCIFDLGKDRFKQQQVALIPSEFLAQVPTQHRTVQYIIISGRTIDAFTTHADLQSLEEQESKILYEDDPGPAGEP